MTQTKYETGATSHAVNDLILFTDNTRELAELRDSVFESCALGVISPYNMHYQFQCDVVDIASYWYKNECRTEISLTGKERHEFATLYVNEFPDWKKEHGY